LQDWGGVLGEFLDGLRTCPIGGGTGFRLADLPEDARVAEMRFELPVDRIHTAGLDALLRAHEPIARDAPVLRARSVRGILKGSIDLVAFHAGRYYLIDYKSTRLGESAAQYTQARIEEDIRSHRYELQYTLYTVALVRLLRARLGPAFDYGQHVGGAIYLYLRALGGGLAADGTPAGVFLRRPEPALIAGIEAMLGGPSG
ncbi:MAG: PD-(D/E)XK nuclease family protein, partial [Gammaproteobacteria bacterium]